MDKRCSSWMVPDHNLWLALLGLGLSLREAYLNGLLGFERSSPRQKCSALCKPATFVSKHFPGTLELASLPDANRVSVETGIHCPRFLWDCPELSREGCG